MRRHILLTILLLFAAIYISCIGNSMGPIQNQLVGSWRLVEIRNFGMESIYPDWSSIDIYGIGNTYSRFLDDNLVEQGRYSIQKWEGGLIMTFKPGNEVWGIWITGDSMYMGKPYRCGGPTFVYYRFDE